MTNEEQEKIRAAKAAYQREWRRKNPDKIRQYQQKYWSKKAKSNAEAAE